MKVEYIIVGLGLSGIAVAEQLRKNKRSFMVVADQSQQASKVAGGLMNPVVLKRFKMAWNAEEHYITAKKYYADLEKLLNTKLVEQIPIYRKFSSIEEQNNWFEAADNPQLAPFLNTDLLNEIEGVKSDFKFGKVENTGLLDTTKLLENYREFLRTQNLLIEESFDFSALHLAEKNKYKETFFKRIVFCEGFGMLQNPYFNYLPLVGNKGEYIHIKTPKLKLDKILKAAIFIIPCGDNIFKVGATYNREFDNQNASENARTQLINKLKKILLVDFEVIGQEAAVRATVKDRKPLIGQHPIEKSLYVCNGFGSRGILMCAPMAQYLFNFTEKNEPIPIEIDSKRYESLFPSAADSL